MTLPERPLARSLHEVAFGSTGKKGLRSVLVRVYLEKEAAMY